MGYVFRIAAATGRGVVKDHNEDRVLADGLVAEEGSFGVCAADFALAAVFDGVSTGGHGAQAAQAAAETLSQARQNGWPGPVAGAEQAHGALVALLDEANERVCDVAASCAGGPGGAGASTTAAGVCLGPGDALHVFHAGDSRVYRLRKGYLARRTEDHSVVGELLRVGAPAEAVEQALRDSAHVVTRAFGLKRAAGVAEVSDPEGFFLIGDVYLACTDGITDALDDQAIREVLGSDEPIERQARRLVEDALAAGSQDNASVVLVRVEQ